MHRTLLLAFLLGAALLADAAVPTCSYIGQKFENPYDCSSFYICDQVYQATLVYCASGLYFNPVTQVCDAPSIANCNLAPQCATYGETFPDSTSCSAYWFCDPTLNLVHVTCGAGLYYYPPVHGCNSNPAYCSSTSCSFPGATYADSTYCSAYYYCNSLYQLEHHYCPAGYYYYPPLGGCSTSSVYCSSPSCSSPGTTHADNEDCTSYYYCDPASQLQHFTCPAGEYYYPPTSTCSTYTGYCYGYFTCSYVGQQFADVNNCFSYFICNSVLSPVHVACSTGYAYDSALGTCVFTGGVCVSERADSSR